MEEMLWQFYAYGYVNVDPTVSSSFLNLGIRCDDLRSGENNDLMEGNVQRSMANVNGSQMSWMVDFNIQKNDGADSDHDHDHDELAREFNKAATMDKTNNAAFLSFVFMRTWTKMLQKSESPLFHSPDMRTPTKLMIWQQEQVLIVDYRLIFPSGLAAGVLIKGFHSQGGDMAKYLILHKNALA
ncbi:hypothetical protein L1987_37428 [Smallanthus sonchifolius]|uniref:Uncharacterized protein n=1 Tax=Smallanthus sonchifolius TaxID=185202 RepID=A0ACB9HG52_9ASTR|nr:hypothetical protein L1987_37428 [Smallanthus sonchifolius]